MRFFILVSSLLFANISMASGNTYGFSVNGGEFYATSVSVTPDGEAHGTFRIDGQVVPVENHEGTHPTHSFNGTMEDGTSVQLTAISGTGTGYMTVGDEDPVEVPLDEIVLSEDERRRLQEKAKQSLANQQ